MKLKKTRSDAWGETLPEETRWRLYRWSKPLAEGEDPRPELHTYELAKAQLEKEGVTPPARPGWYRFLARMRLEDKLQLVCNARESGEGAREISRASVSDKVAAETFRALAVDAAMNGDEKGADLYSAASARFAAGALHRADLDLRARAQTVKEAELALAREKFEAAERRLNAAKETANDTQLTNEQKLAKMKEIFG